MMCCARCSLVILACICREHPKWLLPREAPEKGPNRRYEKRAATFPNWTLADRGGNLDPQELNKAVKVARTLGVPFLRVLISSGALPKPLECRGACAIALVQNQLDSDMAIKALSLVHTQNLSLDEALAQLGWTKKSDSEPASESSDDSPLVGVYESDFELEKQSELGFSPQLVEAAQPAAALAKLFANQGHAAPPREKSGWSLKIQLRLRLGIRQRLRFGSIKD